MIRSNSLIRPRGLPRETTFVLPPTPAGLHWREITQARDVPDEWVAREPIFPWEAKVYTVVED